MPPRKPHGKDETKEAILRAADELFGLKSPDSVTVRELADRAGVNHALVHRHFGTKDQVLREVLERHARAFREVMDGDVEHAVTRMFEVAQGRPAFVKIIAQLLLEGRSPRDFTLEEGGSDRLVKLMMTAHPARSADENRLAAATSIALVLSWTFFGPFLRFAAGYEGTEEEANRWVTRAVVEVAKRGLEPVAKSVKPVKSAKIASRPTPRARRRRAS